MQHRSETGAPVGGAGRDPQVVDALVIGSGAAGLTAAIMAKRQGLEVLIVEKESRCGGTTAVSGGEIWIPTHPKCLALAAKGGETDSLEAAKDYLRAVTGPFFDEDKLDTYLRHGPAAIEEIERETAVEFEPIQGPDYFPDSPGASFYRTLSTLPLDAEVVKAILPMIGGPLPQFGFLGMTMASRAEVRTFIDARRNLRALGYVMRRIARSLKDHLRYGSAGKLVLGRALVARLMKTVDEMQIPILCDAAARDLIKQDGRVIGAEIETPEGLRPIHARRGVLLATGGFPRDALRRAALYPDQIARLPAATPAPMGNTGDGIRLALAAGGRLNARTGDPAAWYPVSRLPGRRDYKAVWPHMIDRAQPGFIAVLPDGRRFANEATNYHNFCAEMIKAFAGAGVDHAWLIGDARAVRKWGIGFAKPFPMPSAHLRRAGYLKKASSLAALAQITGIDAQALAATVAAFNRSAVKGTDPAFGRGTSAYDVFYSDPQHKPNASLAPLERAPYFAVKLLPGEIATFAGVLTDRHARVLGADNTPVPGLYCIGNDQASIFGGTYPGAGATIGPAMVFGWLAARHLAGGDRPEG